MANNIPAQPALKELRPEEQQFVLDQHNKWREAGVNDQGFPNDVDSNEFMTKYKKATEGYYDDSKNSWMPPKLKPVPGVDVKSLLEKKVPEPPANSGGDYLRAAGNVGLELGHAALNPVDWASGAEFLGRLALEPFRDRSISPEPIEDLSGLLRSIGTGVGRIQDEQVIKPMRIADTAAAIKTFNDVGGISPEGIPLRRADVDLPAQSEGAPLSSPATSEAFKENQNIMANVEELKNKSDLQQKLETYGELAGALLMGTKAPAAALGLMGKVGKGISKLPGLSAVGKLADAKAFKAAFYALKPSGTFLDKMRKFKREEKIGKTLLEEGVLDGPLVPSFQTMESRIAQKHDEFGQLIGSFIKKADDIQAGGKAKLGIGREDIASQIENTVLTPLKRRGAPKEVINKIEDFVANMRNVKEYGPEITFSEAQDVKKMVGGLAKFDRNTITTNEQALARAAYADVYEIINENILGGLERVLPKSMSKNDLALFKEAKKKYADLSDALKSIQLTVRRDEANRFFSLTDYLAGVAGAAMGDPSKLSSFAKMVLLAGTNKMGRSYGNQLLAQGLGKISKGPSLGDFVFSTTGASSVQNPSEALMKGNP